MPRLKTLAFATSSLSAPVWPQLCLSRDPAVPRSCRLITDEPGVTSWDRPNPAAPSPGSYQIQGCYVYSGRLQDQAQMLREELPAGCRRAGVLLPQRTEGIAGVERLPGELPSAGQARHQIFSPALLPLV